MSGDFWEENAARYARNTLGAMKRRHEEILKHNIKEFLKIVRREHIRPQMIYRLDSRSNRLVDLKVVAWRIIDSAPPAKVRGIVTGPRKPALYVLKNGEVVTGLHEVTHAENSLAESQPSLPFLVAKTWPLPSVAYKDGRLGHSHLIQECLRALRDQNR